MKKRIMLIILALAVMTGVGVYAVYGNSGSADITNDPLITLSYLNEDYWEKIEDAIKDAIKEALSGESFDEEETLDETEEETKSETEEETNSESESESDSETEATVPGVTDTAAFVYEVLHLKEGDVVLADTPCEIILRSGSANAYLSGNDSGIADLTGGTDLKEGVAFTPNHLLLVPRGGDGRGFIVTSSEAYIMVRGGYNLVAEEVE